MLDTRISYRTVTKVTLPTFSSSPFAHSAGDRANRQAAQRCKRGSRTVLPLFICDFQMAVLCELFRVFFFTLVRERCPSSSPAAERVETAVVMNSLRASCHLGG